MLMIPQHKENNVLVNIITHWKQNSVTSVLAYTMA